HGHNGLVFPAGDVGALADCLREAFADPGRLRRWGQAGLEMIAGYGYRQVTLGLVRALEHAVGEVQHDR
ncbi:MAG: glycosyltransferase family 1 protein, partial [Betaproteobacteria bacterium]